MSRTKVTRAQAEKVLQAVRDKFPAYVGHEGGVEPVLMEDYAWSGNPAPFAVVWEEGPCSWACLFTAGGADEEMVELAKEFGATVTPVEPYVQTREVYVEPMTGWALGVYAGDQS